MNSLRAVSLIVASVWLAGCWSGGEPDTRQLDSIEKDDTTPRASVQAAALGAPGAYTNGAEPEARPPLADVVSVKVHGQSGALEFEVTIASPDTGCKQYADWWEVVSTDGRLLYRRILRHSHVDEQPFARSGGPVEVDPDRLVWVRAHMHPTGYGGSAMKGAVREGFAPADPEPGFADELAKTPPLPEGCSF